MTGNGGVGKSYLIRTIIKWCEKILGGPGQMKPKVLILSYAAIAASLIGKHMTYLNNYFKSKYMLIFGIFQVALPSTLELVSILEQNKPHWEKKN